MVTRLHFSGVPTNRWKLDEGELLKDPKTDAVVALEGDGVRVEDFTFLVPPLVRLTVEASGKSVELDSETLEGWTKHIEKAG